MDMNLLKKEDAIPEDLKRKVAELLCNPELAKEMKKSLAGKKSKIFNVKNRQEEYVLLRRLLTWLVIYNHYEGNEE